MDVPNAGVAVLMPCRDYSNVVRKPLLGKIGRVFRGSDQCIELDHHLGLEIYDLASNYYLQKPLKWVSNTAVFFDFILLARSRKSNTF